MDRKILGAVYHLKVGKRFFCIFVMKAARRHNCAYYRQSTGGGTARNFKDHWKYQLQMIGFGRFESGMFHNMFMGL